MARKDVLGRRGEDLAGHYLTAQGYRILARNWRCPSGEIDLVALDAEGTVVVVEVKTRSSLAFGAPLEAITAQKLARLRRLAAEWCRTHEVSGPLRIDAVGILAPPGARVRLEHLRGVSR
ncbi:MAG TPA: YraN family protein [Microbacteriaceae bacterium]|nr:YraN family protein [Microbacteriaceae bacterium]